MASAAVDTYAICGTQALGWSSGTSPLDAVAQANDAAAFPESCSPGETGFGGMQGNGGDVRIISTHPVSEGWFSFVHNRALMAASATSSARLHRRLRDEPALGVADQGQGPQERQGDSQVQGQ